MKLWQKSFDLNEQIEKFTVGQDRVLDQELAEYDVYTNMAHAIMLNQQNFLSDAELMQIKEALKQIHDNITKGTFILEEGIEDIHSQIELLLTRNIGEAGKKIHLGRSRNDQVLTDLKLYYRAELKSIGESILEIVSKLILKSDLHAKDLMPGYTHSQIAMTSTFGLWFGAFAESFTEDLEQLVHTINMINRNPLGSAAGYGTSLPIDRALTTSLLGFDGLHVNSIYAQMQRGKTEWQVANALASVAQTTSKISSDICLFVSKNYNLLSIPDEFTTGSSIMPHKKNPDVFELIRAKSSQLIMLPQRIASLSSNLMTGYHRDLQLLKEIIFPELVNLKSCLQMIDLTINGITVHPINLKTSGYEYLGTVDSINQLVNQGMPFRSAYQAVSKKVEAGGKDFTANLNTTHIGSIGNLSNELIEGKAKELEMKLASLNYHEILNGLLD